MKKTSSLVIKMITPYLRAYAMYNMGADFWRNEIAMRDNIVGIINAKYKVHAVRVDNLREDEKKGELKIGLEEILPGEKGCGPYHEFTLFNENAVNNFLDDTDVDKATDLLNRRLICLFSNANKLEWLIAYPYSVTKDEVNVTKVDAGDDSYLFGL